jgi:hypothetical protein
MRKGKEIGTLLECRTQQQFTNFVFRCISMRKFLHYSYQSCLLLILYTVCLLIVNGQRSLADSITNSVTKLESDNYYPKSAIVQAPDASPDLPENEQAPDASPDLPESNEQSPDASPELPESNEQAPAAETSTFPEKFYVRQIQVINSTVFNQNDFAPVVKPFEGRELTAEEARKAADAVTQLYLNKNYLNSRAIPVAPQAGTTDGW